jgi:hypothetical protein
MFSWATSKQEPPQENQTQHGFQPPSQGGFQPQTSDPFQPAPTAPIPVPTHFVDRRKNCTFKRLIVFCKSFTARPTSSP